MISCRGILLSWLCWATQETLPFGMTSVGVCCPSELHKVTTIQPFIGHWAVLDLLEKRLQFGDFYEEICRNIPESWTSEVKSQEPKALKERYSPSTYFWAKVGMFGFFLQFSKDHCRPIFWVFFFQKITSGFFTPSPTKTQKIHFCVVEAVRTNQMQGSAFLFAERKTAGFFQHLQFTGMEQWWHGQIFTECIDCLSNSADVAKHRIRSPTKLSHLLPKLAHPWKGTYRPMHKSPQQCWNVKCKNACERSLFKREIVTSTGSTVSISVYFRFLFKPDGLMTLATTSAFLRFLV